MPGTTVVTVRALLLIASLTVALTVLVRAEDPANIYPFAAGTIQTVDKSGKVFTIITAKGPLTIALTDRTYLYRGKEKLAADKLKIGDSIKINYFTNETGQVFVRRLKVSPTNSPPESPSP
jgi:hypothetical protein